MISRSIRAAWASRSFASQRLGRSAATHFSKTAPPPSSSAGHDTAASPDALDNFLVAWGQHLLDTSVVTHLDELYAQYRSEAGRVLPDVLPYEGRPTKCRRADCQSGGEGIVLVVHLAIQAEGQVYKLTVCSGFAISVDSAAARPDSDVVVTCAHTLEEIQRSSASVAQSVSYVLTSDGSTARPVNRIIASTPRSDLLVLQVHRPETSAPLSTLPLSPYPVPIGHPVLTHLFASPHVPFIQRSKAKLSQGASAENVDQGDVESSVSWLGGNAWRRWGKGVMLGYRSHIGQDVEAGTTSQLPYILTSILPTPGSSGGPLVDAESGAVIGMISGRRMDNRIEGERGWGSAAEQVYEMFALPGFTPASARYRL